MSKNQDLQGRRDAAFARGLGNQLPVYVERARNAELWDVEGRRYIDFGSGIAVLNTGHLHPKVQAAVARQLDAFSHTCLMVTPYGVAVELAEKLNRLAPGPDAEEGDLRHHRCRGGRERIKIARAHTGRAGVIAFGGGFHGRTFMAMALTGKVAPYKAGFGPFPAEVYHAPFPIAYHGVSVADSLAALEHIFKYDIEPARVAAIIIEPVMGEGGFYIAPPEFLQALRKLCDQHGIVLIADEIQTGLRAHRPHVRHRVLRHRARPDDHGQEPGRRLPARGGGRQGAHHGRAAARAGWAAPTPVRPSPARRRWPCSR